MSRVCLENEEGFYLTGWKLSYAGLILLSLARLLAAWLVFQLFCV
jgi:hypothetical protein